MSSPDRLQLNPERERALVIATADKLNDRFRNGAYVWNHENRGLLRRVPRPICVDVDGVLVDYYHSYEPGVEDDRVYSVTPDAADAVKELREIGTVVITTGIIVPGKEDNKYLLISVYGIQI